MLLHKEIHRHWLVPQALEKTNIFVVYIEQSGRFWGRERVGGGREIQEGGDICTPMVNSC